jgi:SAM-dependent MidA family methyltransferase
MSELLPLIQDEIAKAGGAISFADFMELALYHPFLGYYEKGFSQTGRQGDFFTNVSVGALFGQFLGFDFASRARLLPDGQFYVLESGAHDGRLASDILDYLRQFQPVFFERVTYLIVEPSARRAYHQQEVLEPYGKKIQWIKRFTAITAPLPGLCFSNELLDAMPVHVFRWDSSELTWKEWGVGSHAGNLDWVMLPTNTPEAEIFLPPIPPELGQVLPHGFTIEVSPAAVRWWREAASCLMHGWLMTFDYGARVESLIQPERTRGSLRGYSHHHISSNILRNPGEQDITANVNFSHIISAGEAAGFVTEGFGQQGQYLKQLLEKADAAPSEFPLWTASRFRQLTSLIHPEHLGFSFKALIQAKLPSVLS